MQPKTDPIQCDGLGFQILQFIFDMHAMCIICNYLHATLNS